MLTSNKKFLITLFSFLILFIFCISKCFAIVPQSYEFFVNDTANILSSDTEKYIIDQNKKLEAKCGAQIVVVTVNNLEGRSIEDYSTELFRDYGIGNKEKNNGVLLIVSVEDRRMRIEVGYGLEGKLNDAKTGRIQDNYIVPYLSDDKWDEGIRNGFNAILAEVCDEYDITIDGAEVAEDIEHYENVMYFSAFIVFVICLILRHVFSSNFILKWSVAMRSWSCCNCYRCFYFE